jgi:hypothetical protein
MALWLALAFVVDGIDGPLARHFDVKTNAPQYRRGADGPDHRLPHLRGDPGLRALRLGSSAGLVGLVRRPVGALRQCRLLRRHADEDRRQQLLRLSRAAGTWWFWRFS